MLREEYAAPEYWLWDFDTDVLYIDLDYILGADNGLYISQEHDVVAKIYSSLFDWAVENNFVVTKQSHSTFSFNADQGMMFSISLTNNVRVFEREDYETNALNTRYGRPLNSDQVTCGHCSHRNPNRSLICSECGTFFFCTGCQRRRTSAHYDPYSGRTHCSTCGIVCAGCKRWHSGSFNDCNTCSPRYRCGHCGGRFEGTPAVTAGNLVICEGCSEFFCAGCNQMFNYGLLVNDEGEPRCARCVFAGNDDEEHDEEGEITNTKMRFPTIEGRETIRRVGIEIEGANANGMPAGDYIAKALYAEALTEYPKIAQYHAGTLGFAHVERDSSVDWELVIGPVNMASPTDVKKLTRTVKIVREQIKAKVAKFDLRAGLHIHVDATKVGVGQAYNLHLLYSHIEDVMYRLGAAKWPVHRFLVQDNDHNCKPSPKVVGKVKFANSYSRDRYYGLSFSNYFEQMQGNCGCGAVRYGAFEECECRMTKCTFEFRVFNTTANMIKLHAYLALCQALVARATSMEEIKDADAFPGMAFLAKRHRDLPENEQAAMVREWEDRLGFIATLPLTDDEKESIHYCIVNSEMKKVGNGSKALFLPTGREQ